MSLLNPLSNLPGIAARPRQAASLSATLSWYLERAWNALEAMGQRRAAPELHQLAQRLAAEGHEAAAQVLTTAKEWSGR